MCTWSAAQRSYSVPIFEGIPCLLLSQYLPPHPEKSFGWNSGFFITHLIFQCYITIISISAPSGLSTVFHQSVSVSVYVSNDIDDPGGKAACLSDHHFLLSGEIQHSK